MLITSTKLTGTPVLSMQASGPIGQITDIIINPDTLKVIAFRLSGPMVDRNANILDVSSIREYSSLGFIIDDADELIGPDDVIKISKVLDLNFSLIGLKVESKKGSKLGRVTDYTITPDDLIVQQIIVRRPTLKSFVDPELTIHCREIVEITDYKIIVKDEAKTIKEKAVTEDFIPNFVNPFREKQPGFTPADIKDQPKD